MSTVTLDSLAHPVTLGIAAGLLIGKPLGVFGICFIALKLKLAQLPKGMSLVHLAGVSVLCGVGFTMSLFIGSLAFETSGNNHIIDERLGILIASILSAIIGFIMLKHSLPVSERTSRFKRIAHLIQLRNQRI